MNPDQKAWERLQDHAASQLSGGFADRVMRTSRGPTSSAWNQLHQHAAAQLQRGFADRVLRAVRAEMPTFIGQMTLSAVTAAACLLAVVYLHDRSNRIQDERNLADWSQLAADAQDLGQ